MNKLGFKPHSILLAVAFVVWLTVPAWAQNVTLAWDANAETDLAGYKVYYGTASRTYGAPIIIGTQATYTVSGLAPGTYYFAVTAYNTSGLESGFSNEVTATVTQTPPLSGLAAAFALNEGNGTSIADASGNSNNGTLNGPTWTTAGKYGNALSFDGVNDYITIPNSSSLDISGTNLTISLWLNIPDSVGAGDKAIIAKPWTAGSMSAPYYQYGIEYDNAARTLDLYFADTSGTLRGPFSMTPSLGVWTHVAFTYDGSTVKGYLDGAQRFSAAASQSIQARGQSLLIGVDGAYAEAFGGQLDEIRIYNRALSQAEIQSDMNTPVGVVQASRCDINSDQGVNVLDIQRLINVILGSACPGTCDINGDGSVNILDLQILGNVILGIRTCPS